LFSIHGCILAEKLLEAFSRRLEANPLNPPLTPPYEGGEF
jgi:hypothetical protein